MDIIIYKVPKHILKEIDTMAKEKKMSRNEFLQIYFTNLANQDVVFNSFNKNRKLIESIEESLNRNTELLQRINNEILKEH